MNRVRVWLAALGLMAVAALPVAAQVQTGSILVRVTDAQGGAVPGVTVTLDQPGAGRGHDDGRHRYAAA